MFFPVLASWLAPDHLFGINIHVPVKVMCWGWWSWSNTQWSLNPSSFAIIPSNDLIGRMEVFLLLLLLSNSLHTNTDLVIDHTHWSYLPWVLVSYYNVHALFSPFVLVQCGLVVILVQQAQSTALLELLFVLTEELNFLRRRSLYLQVIFWLPKLITYPHNFVLFDRRWVHMCRKHRWTAEDAARICEWWLTFYPT